MRNLMFRGLVTLGVIIGCLQLTVQPSLAEIDIDDEIDFRNFSVTGSIFDEPEKLASIMDDREQDELTEEQLSVVKADSEPYEFQAEVHRLMDIIINSLYNNKEVFLRELISNSVDAIEKIRFAALEDPKLLGKKEFRIVVESDEFAKTLSVSDNGIGMTKEDLINNLGTVAKSGTANFLEALSQGADVSLIGQFGVGFYSAFLVSDKVTVASKHDDGEQHIWESAADGAFVVAKDPRGNTLERGTRVTLHLKEDALEFCKRKRIEEILNKYSQFVSFPIYLRVEETVKEEVTDDEHEGDDDVEVKDEEDKPKTRTVERKVHKLQQQNKQKPIWLRQKEEISDEEYLSFYKSIVGLRYPEPPIVHMHFSAEGEVEFKALLYIPRSLDDDPYKSFFGKKQDVKLYVRRVLISDQTENLVPSWMSFLQGVVDSDDLPLKVDRDAVSQHKTMKVIQKKIARKVIEVIRKLSVGSDKAEDEIAQLTEKADEEERRDEDGNMLWTDDEKIRVEKLNTTVTTYESFWDQFGKNARLGCVEEENVSTDIHKLAKLFRYKTSKSLEKPISIQRVLDRMPENATNLYYMTGESVKQMMSSPLIQGFLKKDIEVLLMTDVVDEQCASGIGSYEGKKFTSIEKAHPDMDEGDEDAKTYKDKLAIKYKPLTDWWSKRVAEITRVDPNTSRVKKCVISMQLVQDPVAVSSSKFGLSAFNEKVYRYQTFHDDSRMVYQRNNRALDINPQHTIIIQMLKIFLEDGATESFIATADELLQIALLSSGFPVDEPAHIARKLYRAIAQDVNCDLSQESERIDVSDIRLPTSDKEEEEVDPAGLHSEEDLEEYMKSLSRDDEDSTDDSETPTGHDEL